MTNYEEQLRIPAPVERLFEFLLKPANVAMVSDPSSGLSLLMAPETVQVGSVITFRIAAFGQVREVTHEVTVVEHPNKIVEVQREGPLKSWRHTHIFERDGDGALLIEQIDFEPPGGLVGLLVTADKIVQQLEEGLYYKEQALRRLAAQGAI